ncbi:hypothetical protein ABFV47_01395 [Mycolicibacterium fortuitum]|uniref:hypothetical protein n=1 Tax=Mycolicibacterium fortuitum TaxID=1766 RepID=UPI003A89D28A
MTDTVVPDTSPDDAERDERTEASASGTPEASDGSQEQQGGNDADAQANGSADSRHGGSKLHREAAAYRVRAREAEAERDALAARVEALQRAEILRLAAEGGMAAPEDLFALTEAVVADYLNEESDVSPEAVAEAVSELLAERPGLRKRTPGYDPSQGTGGRPQPKREPNWGALFSA